LPIADWSQLHKCDDTSQGLRSHHPFTPDPDGQNRHSVRLVTDEEKPSPLLSNQTPRLPLL
jgi:hypothetical protein